MNLKRFFELANQEWPVEEGKPKHSITFDPVNGVTIWIWLCEIEKWQSFYVTDDEFDDPELLVKGMVNLLELLKQKAAHAD